jgi:hypothetical protein
VLEATKAGLQEVKETCKNKKAENSWHSKRL